jgi:hypothetical protein
VRGLAADIGDEAGEYPLLELQHVGGRDLMRHQHQGHVGIVQLQLRRRTAAGGRRRQRQAAACRALHGAQDLFGDLLEVALALAQVLVLHLVELARDDLQLRGQRPLGVVVAVTDPVLDALDHLLVLQQHQVHVQQGLELLRCVLRAELGHRLLQAVQLVDHRIASAPDAVDLAVHLGRLDEIVGDVHTAAGHQHGTPNGNAACHGESVDGKGHVTRLRRTCR